MSSLVARFTSSRRYLWLGLAAVTGTALSVWSALRGAPVRLDSWTIPAVFNPSFFSPLLIHPSINFSWIAAALFAIPAVGLLLLAFRPAIEIHDTYLRIGPRLIPWSRIRRVDQTGWNVPLFLYLTLDDESRVGLLHAGDVESSASLLRQLRRASREALLDGIPYRQFWGERAGSSSSALPPLAPPRAPLLRPEDEEEVERMFQRLKSVGHLEQRRDPDQG